MARKVYLHLLTIEYITTAIAEPLSFLNFTTVLSYLLHLHTDESLLKNGYDILMNSLQTSLVDQAHPIKEFLGQLFGQLHSVPFSLTDTLEALDTLFSFCSKRGFEPKDLTVPQHFLPFDLFGDEKEHLSLPQSFILSLAEFRNKSEAHPSEHDISALFTVLGQHEFDFDLALSDGRPPVQLAAAFDFPLLLEHLLLMGANPHNTYKNTLPLFWATAGGHISCCKILLHYGATLQSHTHGKSVLMVAAERSQPELVKLYVELGAHLQEQNAQGKTPLHQAMIHQSHLPTIETLIQLGADLHAANNNSLETPLHFACLLGREDVAAYLLEHGADPFALDSKGETPFLVSCKTHLPACRKLFLHHSDTVKQAAFLRATNLDGCNALHLAAQRGSLDLVKELIALGLRIEDQNRHGQTALEMAKAFQHIETSHYLEGIQIAEQEKNILEKAVSSLHSPLKSLEKKMIRKPL